MSYHSRRYNQKTIFTSSAPGFPSLLTILFIGLKLTGHITWPWIWVLSPLWIYTLIVILVILGTILLALLLR